MRGEELETTFTAVPVHGAHGHLQRSPQYHSGAGYGAAQFVLELPNRQPSEFPRLAERDFALRKQRESQFLSQLTSVILVTCGTLGESPRLFYQSQRS